MYRWYNECNMQEVIIGLGKDQDDTWNRRKGGLLSRK